MTTTNETREQCRAVDLYALSLTRNELDQSHTLTALCYNRGGLFSSWDMSLHGHHHSLSYNQLYEREPSYLNRPGASGGAYPIPPILGSTNTPTNSHISTFASSSRNVAATRDTNRYSEEQSTPPFSSGLPPPRATLPTMSTSTNYSSNQSFDTSRRPPALFGRQAEELHIPQDHANMGQQPSREHDSYNPYHSNPTSQINSSSALPLPLQSGNPGRPSVASANTEPSTVPVLPPISTQSQSQTYSTPSRSSTAGHSHNYSRSSPAAPFVNTPEDSKFTSPSSHKYTPQTPHGASYSPLGLADIRPRADSGHSDGPTSANPYSDYSSVPTNCNYLAPWAVYAFDWCKWPVHQQGLGDVAGKMAIGSYLEDGHNFVCLALCLCLTRSRLTGYLDTNTRYSDSSGSRTRSYSRSATIWRGIHENCGSHPFLSCNTHIMGTGIIVETVLRSARDVRRSLTVMVSSRTEVI